MTKYSKGGNYSGRDQRSGRQGIDLLATLRRGVSISKDWGGGDMDLDIKKVFRLSQPNKHGQPHSRRSGRDQVWEDKLTPQGNHGKRDFGQLSSKQSQSQHRSGEIDSCFTEVEQTNGVRQKALPTPQSSSLPLRPLSPGQSTLQAYKLGESRGPPSP